MKLKPRTQHYFLLMSTLGVGMLGSGLEGGSDLLKVRTLVSEWWSCDQSSG